MKVKKFNKKLTLNKRTVAHLGDDVMEHVKGGTQLTEVCGPSIDWRLSVAPVTCRLHGCPPPDDTCREHSCYLC